MVLSLLSSFHGTGDVLGEDSVSCTLAQVESNLPLPLSFVGILFCFEIGTGYVFDTVLLAVLDEVRAVSLAAGQELGLARTNSHVDDV